MVVAAALDVGWTGLRNERPAKQMRPGRNEPCPCGSGKKFKRAAAPAEPIRQDAGNNQTFNRHEGELPSDRDRDAKPTSHVPEGAASSRAPA